MLFLACHCFYLIFLLVISSLGHFFEFSATAESIYTEQIIFSPLPFQNMMPSKRSLARQAAESTPPPAMKKRKQLLMDDYVSSVWFFFFSKYKVSILVCYDCCFSDMEFWFL